MEMSWALYDKGGESWNYKKSWKNVKSLIFCAKLHMTVSSDTTVKPRYSVFQGTGQDYAYIEVLFIANI